MSIDYAKVGESGYKLHPIQKTILEYLIEHEEGSPVRVSEATGLKLGNASYHFKVLAKRGWIGIKEQIPRRGALENVYTFRDAAPVTRQEI